MTLSELRTRLQDLYGNTLASEATFLTSVINSAYQKICARADWWWLETKTDLTYEGIVTEATGLTLTNGTAEIPVLVTPDSDFDDGYLSTGDHTYRITDITGTVFTIDTDFTEVSSTNQSVTYWNDAKELPADFGEAVSVTLRNDPNHKPLREVHMADIDVMGPNPSSRGSEWPEAFCVYRDVNSTAGAAAQAFNLRISPPPDTVVHLGVRYRVMPSDLSADGDIPLIPVKHHQTLLDASIVELLKTTYEYPDVIRQFEIEAERGIFRMLKDQGKFNAQSRFGRRGSSPARSALPFKTINTTVTSV